MALIGSVSGSHTKLTDGTSYLIAGSNVTITTGSNGSVTIAATGGGSGVGTGFNDGGNTLNTTSSVAFAGLLGDSYYVANAGADTFFFVSGSTGSKNTDQRGVAVFGGDLLASGNTIIVGATTITGALRQGAQLTATGQGSHAQGIGSVAQGTYSHAEGYFTTARASYSHAGGMGTITSGTGQTAVGKYNSRGNNFSLFVVGDGTGDTDADRGDILRANPGNSIGTGIVEVTGTLASTIGVNSAFFVTSGANMTLKVDGEGGQTNRAIVLINNTNPSPTFGSDVFLYVTGSAFSKDDVLTRGVAVFAGDTVMSGALWGGYQTFGGLNTTQLNLKAGHYNIAGAGSSMDSNPTKQDILVYITGTTSSKNGATRGVTVMAGDVVVSGTLYDGNGTAYIPGAGGGGGGGDSAATYVVISATGSLSNERVLTAGTGISITDGGAGGNVTLSANVSGTFNDVSGKLSTTGTLAVAGNQGFNYFANNVGSNVSFYVSGSSGLQSAPASQGVSVFGGDVVLSGGLYGGYNSFIGDTYLSAQAAKIQIVGASTGNPPAISATDTFLFVSGAANLSGASAKKVVFGGDVVVSGNIRTSEVELGGASAFVSSSNGSSLEIGAATQVLVLSGGAASSPNPRNFPEANFFVSGAIACITTNTRGAAVFGGDLFTSGQIFFGGDASLANANSRFVQLGQTAYWQNWYPTNPTINMAGKFGVTLSRLEAVASTFSLSGKMRIGGSISETPTSYLHLSSSTGVANTTPLKFQSGSLVLVPETGAVEFNGTNLFITSGTTRQTILTTLTNNAAVTSSFMVTTASNMNLIVPGTGTVGQVARSIILTSDRTPTPVTGSDVFLFVSGSTSSKGTSIRGTALFGGDVVISGTLHGGVLTGTNTGLTIQANKVQVTSTTLSFGQSGGSDVGFFVSGSPGSRGVAFSGGTSLFGGDLYMSGSTYLGTVSEYMTLTQSLNSIQTFNMSSGSIFHSKALAGDITANFTNVPTHEGRAVSANLIVSQSITAYIVSAIQIGGASQTLLWANGVTPTGNPGKHDVFGFSLIRSGSAWTVLGQMSTYG